MENNFLKKKYDLHNAPEVEAAVKREERKTGENIANDPEARIQSYLDRLRNIIEPKELEGHPDFDRKERNLELVKTILHKNFVIKPEEIPEGYFENQKRIMREQGHGEVEIGREQREQLTEVIIADQESSLDNWVDYLTSKDAAYPDWLKYYAIRSILSLGEYDKEKKQFTNRSRGTTKPFPDLDREALAYVLDVLEKKYKGEGIDLSRLEAEDKEKFQKLLQGENFGKLYAFAIEKVAPESKESLENVRGEWVKYEQNSDHMPLVESLQGHATGWCVAGESTARVYFQRGDFYVYYSLDKSGKPKIPRAAIQMDGNVIGQVRGIAPDQNLDPYIGGVVQEKLKQFPDGKAYEKKTADMKRLTELEKKTKSGKEPGKDDLRFLYEIDSKIEGFGYQRDPRIGELLAGRDMKTDLSTTLDIPKEKISTTRKEALRGDILFHYGDLYLERLTSAEGFNLPESVVGDLYLSSLTSPKGLKLPESVGGDLDLSRLTSPKGLKLPESVGGDLYLNGLTSAEKNKLRKEYPNLKII